MAIPTSNRDGLEPSDTPATDIVRSVHGAGKGRNVRVRDLRDELGHASFAPALLLVSLMLVTPLSGIPGFTTIAGLTIVLLCWQYITGRRQIWLPEFILRRKIQRTHLRQACRWVLRPLYVIDTRSSAERFSALTRWPYSGFFYVFCMLIGLAMPLMEVLPMTSSLMGMVIATIAIALVTRDGLFALAGLALFALIALLVSALVAAIF